MIRSDCIQFGVALGWTSTAGATDTASTNPADGRTTNTHSEWSTASLHETGSTDASHWYTLDKTDSKWSGSTRTGQVGGRFSATGSRGETSTAIESNAHGANTATFTEILSDTASSTASGNAAAGYYTLSQVGSRTASFVQAGLFGGRTYAVNENSHGGYSATTRGFEGVSGTTATEAATTTDSATESVGGTNSFTLVSNGIDASTTTSTANGVTGATSSWGTGSDVYTLSEWGTTGAGSYSQSVAGTDNYMSVESGNQQSQTDSGTVSGGGSWTRSTSGTGSTLASGSGTNSYAQTTTGNAIAGVFGQTLTGQTRYQLVEQFADISNANAGSTPGNVKFHPHGLAFRDPGPEKNPGPDKNSWSAWLWIPTLPLKVVGRGIDYTGQGLAWIGKKTGNPLMEFQGNAVSAVGEMAEDMSMLINPYLAGKNIAGFRDRFYAIQDAVANNTPATGNNALLLSACLFAGDFTGTNQIVEGIEGKDLLTREKLTTKERQQRFVKGAISLALLLTPFMKGPKGTPKSAGAAAGAKGPKPFEIPNGNIAGTLDNPASAPRVPEPNISRMMGEKPVGEPGPKVDPDAVFEKAKEPKAGEAELPPLPRATEGTTGKPADTSGGGHPLRGKLDSPEIGKPAPEGLPPEVPITFDFPPKEFPALPERPNLPEVGEIAPKPPTAKGSPSRSAIEAFADSVQDLPGKGSPGKTLRPRSVARLDGPVGEYFGRSQKGNPAQPHHPVVEQILKELPPDPTSPGQIGRCGEVDAINQALRAHEAKTGKKITTIEQAREVLKGSKMQTANVIGREGVPGVHGTPKAPCTVCNPLLTRLWIAFDW